jgi:hypothetical protein
MDGAIANDRSIENKPPRAIDGGVYPKAGQRRLRSIGRTAILPRLSQSGNFHRLPLSTVTACVLLRTSMQARILSLIRGRAVNPPRAYKLSSICVSRHSGCTWDLKRRPSAGPIRRLYRSTWVRIRTPYAPCRRCSKEGRVGRTLVNYCE